MLTTETKTVSSETKAITIVITLFTKLALGAFWGSRFPVPVVAIPTVQVVAKQDANKTFCASRSQPPLPLVLEVSSVSDSNSHPDPRILIRIQKQKYLELNLERHVSLV